MSVIPTNTKYTSGTNVYTFPVGCTFIIVELVGQGGSGGTGNTFQYNAGGGAGGWYVKKLFLPYYPYICNVGDTTNGVSNIFEAGGNYGELTNFTGTTNAYAGGGGGGFPGVLGTRQGSGGTPFNLLGNDNFSFFGGDIIIDIPGGYGGAGSAAFDYGRTGCGGRSFYCGNTVSKTGRVASSVASLNLTNGSGSMAPSTAIISNQGSNGVAYITEYYSPTPPTFTKLLGGGNIGTYTSPSGCFYITVEIVGGGGNSGQCNGTIAGGGGGGGGYIRKNYLPGSYNYEVGGWGDRSIFSTEEAGPGGDGETPTVDSEYASGGTGGTVFALGSFLDVEGEGGTCSREYTAGAGGASYLSGRGPSAWSTSYVAGLGRALRYGGGASSNINDPNSVLGADGAIFITEWYGSSGSGSNSINRHIDRVNTVDGRNIDNDVSLAGRFINRKLTLSRTIDQVNLNGSDTGIPTVTKITLGAGNYTSPAGCVYIIVEMVGGGGSGGKGVTAFFGPVSGGGGGGGAYIRKTKPPGTYAYSVGAGGASIPVGIFTNGNNGGTSTFSTESCFGGVGGFYAGTFHSEANGGSGGDVSGGSVAPYISSIGSGGSASGLDGSGTVVGCGIGGSSKFSGCPVGVVSSVAVAGLDGSLYGGGGNGSIGDTATGAGAAGLIFITEYYS